MALAAAILLWAACGAALARPRIFWTATLALLPLGVDRPLPAVGVHLTLPLEAMMLIGGAALLIREGRDILPARAQAMHPLSLMILAQTAWVLVSAVFSGDPSVSLKSGLLRGLYVGCFYFLGLRLLEAASGFERAVIATGAGFIPVVILALSRFVRSGFDPKAVYESAQPFFQNRVDLCAALCLWLPLAMAVGHARAGNRLTPFERSALSISIVLAGAALVGLRGRAALGALVLSVAFGWLARRRPPALVSAALFVFVLATVGAVADLVAYRSASARPGIRPPLSSVRSSLLANPPFNDQSFTERANRWSAAARMALDRPLAGFGPGTFERHYAAYQKPWETTPRSTWGGDEGDSHSELMTAVAEQGLPGLAMLLGVLGVAVFTAARRARSDRGRIGLMPASLAASLCAFLILNGPNSLLDVDKVAPFFWMACAAAVNSDRRSPCVATSPEVR